MTSADEVNARILKQLQMVAFTLQVANENLAAAILRIEAIERRLNELESSIQRDRTKRRRS